MHPRLRDVKLQFESNYNRCCDQQATIGYRTRDSDAKFPTVSLTIVEPVMECDGLPSDSREICFFHLAKRLLERKCIHLGLELLSTAWNKPSTGNRM